MSLLLRLPDDLGLHVLSYLDLYAWCQYDSACCSRAERPHTLNLLGKLKSITGDGVPHTAVAWLADRCPLIYALDVYPGHVAVQATVASSELNEFKCIQSLILNYGVVSNGDFFSYLTSVPGTLRYLRIEGGGWVAPADVRTFIQRCTELRHIYFENNPVYEEESGPNLTDSNIMGGMQWCKKLSDVELVHVSPSEAALEQLWALGHRLRRLDLMICTYSSLTTNLSQFNFEHMLILRLSGTWNIRFARSLVASSMPRLKHLTLLPRNSLECDDLFKSFGSLCPVLESLSLNSWCFFSAQSLIDSVISRLKKLRVLDLRVDNESGIFPASICDEISQYLRRKKRRTKFLLSDDTGMFRKDLSYKKVNQSECYHGEILPLRRLDRKTKFRRAAGAYENDHDWADDVAGNVFFDSEDSDVSSVLDRAPVSEVERGKLVAAAYDDIMGGS